MRGTHVCVPLSVCPCVRPHRRFGMLPRPYFRLVPRASLHRAVPPPRQPKQPRLSADRHNFYQCNGIIRKQRRNLRRFGRELRGSARRLGDADVTPAPPVRCAAAPCLPVPCLLCLPGRLDGKHAGLNFFPDAPVLCISSAGAKARCGRGTATSHLPRADFSPPPTPLTLSRTGSLYEFVPSP